MLRGKMSSVRCLSGGNSSATTFRRKKRSSRKAPVAMSFFKIAVRRGDQTEICGDVGRPAEASERPFLEHP